MKDLICKSVTKLCFIGVLGLGVALPSQAIEITQPKIKEIVEPLIEQGLYTRAQLQAIFAPVKVQQSILDAMQNPAEYKLTWGKYRKIFLKEDRISQGVQFWNEHADALQRAEQQYGVPAKMIVSIIGVESKFGRYKGKHKVLDSLATLVVGYPRRSKFFGKELKDFLILSKQNNLDSNAILGSYAGAVGFPQFISSSYRQYAVDFSADGKTDLINQPVDAIGSVANYFKKNGWLTGRPVTSQAYKEVPLLVAEQASRERKVKFTPARLRELGAQLPAFVSDSEKLNVLMLDASETVDESSPKTHIVRIGDTACAVARKYKVSCEALSKRNKLDSQAHIYRDQKLKIPSADGSSSKYTKQPLYFYTLENFYVITRYNHSVLYAMAVYELSEAIEKAKLSQASL